MEQLLARRKTIQLETINRSQLYPHIPSARFQYDPLFSCDMWCDTMMLVYPEGSVVVDNTDTFALVNQLSKMTYHPVIAYFGDPLFPGGDVTNGENLFEHKLFRRSSISNTLRADMFYPLQTMDEAIQSPRVTIFKNSNGELLNSGELWDTSVITVPAPMNVPPLNCAGRIQGDDQWGLRNSISTLFQAAAKNGHDIVVIAGIGRGSWKIPANELTRIFGEVLNCDGYRDLFSRVQFSCDVGGGAGVEQQRTLKRYFMRDIRRNSVNGQ